MLTLELSATDISLMIAIAVLLLLLLAREKKEQPTSDSKKGPTKLPTKIKTLFKNTQKELSTFELSPKSKKILAKLPTELKDLIKNTQQKLTIKPKASAKNTQQKPSTIQPSTNSKKGQIKISIKLKTLAKNTQQKLSTTQLSTKSKNGLMTLSTKLRALFKNTPEKPSMTQPPTKPKKDHMKLPTKLKGLGLALFIVLVSSITASAAYSLILLDKIVHGTLYSYGLQFSYDWATPYWTILRTTQILVGILAGVTLTSMTYVYRKHIYTKPQIKTTTTEKTSTPSPAAEPQEQSIFGLTECTHCGNSFPRPIQMLDYQADEYRIINVCPFCNDVIQPVAPQTEPKRTKKAVQKEKEKKSQETQKEKPKKETKETVTAQTQ